MNYEQKYKEALERVRELYQSLIKEGTLSTPKGIETIFPELKESEDERIRKELIERFKWELKGAEEQDAAGCSRQKDIAMFKRGIAWLEKQGDKNIITPQWMIDFLKEHRRHFATPMDYDEVKETDGKLIAVIKWLEGNPQLKQKTAWSEEDEEKLNSIIEVLGDNSLLVQWLKSLKPNHWKPSEEQIGALNYAYCELFKRGENSEGNNCVHPLMTLIDDLKKL